MNICITYCSSLNIVQDGSLLGNNFNSIILSSIAKEKGFAIIDPTGNYDVIAGHGTIGIELHQEVENLDAILVAVGGGSLVSGEK